jgi:hypothetical protein
VNPFLLLHRVASDGTTDCEEDRGATWRIAEYNCDNFMIRIAACALWPRLAGRAGSIRSGTVNFDKRASNHRSACLRRCYDVLYLVLKVVVSGLLIGVVSGIAKRSPWLWRPQPCLRTPCQRPSSRRAPRCPVPTNAVSRLSLDDLGGMVTRSGRVGLDPRPVGAQLIPGIRTRAAGPGRPRSRTAATDRGSFG